MLLALLGLVQSLPRSSALKTSSGVEYNLSFDAPVLSTPSWHRDVPFASGEWWWIMGNDNQWQATTKHIPTASGFKGVPYGLPWPYPFCSHFLSLARHSWEIWENAQILGAAGSEYRRLTVRYIDVWHKCWRSEQNHDFLLSSASLCQLSFLKQKFRACENVRIYLVFLIYLSLHLSIDLQLPKHYWCGANLPSLKQFPPSDYPSAGRAPNHWILSTETETTSDSVDFPSSLVRGEFRHPQKCAKVDQHDEWL